MADERHRELERRASAGDVEAEAKLLLERVRSGDLTEGRLRLAASLQHPASKIGLGNSLLDPILPSWPFSSEDRRVFYGGAAGVLARFTQRLLERGGRIGYLVALWAGYDHRVDRSVLSPQAIECRLLVGEYLAHPTDGASKRASRAGHALAGTDNRLLSRIAINCSIRDKRIDPGNDTAGLYGGGDLHEAVSVMRDAVITWALGYSEQREAAE